MNTATGPGRPLGKPMKIRKLIKTDGTEVDIAEPLTMKQIAKLIGADTLDTVIMRHMGKYPVLHVMLVDDHGWETQTIDHGDGHLSLKPVRALKPINATATELYLMNCRPGTTHQIAGDVVIVPDADFEP